MKTATLLLLCCGLAYAYRPPLGSRVVVIVSSVPLQQVVLGRKTSNVPPSQKMQMISMIKALRQRR